ncbi:unnamed protein product [Phytomonas sp. EM1]|nr:unnamed protein product [Phytomonas sp. EM1]|eukprot:CCW63173.1 unnamed protein product [Phytomonas sp. isolate EM1]
MSTKVNSDTFSRGIGGRFVSLLAPVSATMILVVWSVNNLTPISAFSQESPLTLLVDEENQDSAFDKLGASFLNACCLIAVVVIMTFLVLVLYKYRCTGILFCWLMFSAGSILFIAMWEWLDLVCTRFQIPYDIITMTLLIWNLGAVGMVSLFYYVHPLFTQLYLVFASVLLAWSLTALPEWTTWAILLAIATYDILAVLCPHGPLKLLLEAAETQNEPIPGFIYDSSRTLRPVVTFQEQQPIPVDSDTKRIPPPRQEGSNQKLPLVAYLKHSSPFKLGLGDFIFYALLVGRAAMSGFLPFFFCLVTILSGMIATLVSLFVFRDLLHALPALPISIFLATAVYFITEYIVKDMNTYFSLKVYVL